MTTFRTYFTFRVDTWTPDGESIVEHVAGVEDYQVALATYRAACERWPGAPITLRQGSRVIEGQSASSHGVVDLEPRKRDGGERNLCRVPRSCERTLLPDLPARDVFALCVFVLILLVKCLNSPYR